MVRQRTLTPSFQGSNPCSPAKGLNRKVWAFFCLLLAVFRGPTNNFRLVKNQNIDNVKIMSYHMRIQYGYYVRRSTQLGYSKDTKC